MKIQYINWAPKAETLALVQAAERIIKEYASQGYILTLRQLYYQFVARAIIVNSERSYKNLGSMITKARMAGMLSWEAIEDRNRAVQTFWMEEDIEKPIKDLPYFIRYDRWARQDYYVEVWVEKEALGNVVKKACTPYCVPHLSCKGYLSASEAWRAGRRFKVKREEGYGCVLIHLGDHDPSGIDMTRDNKDRLNVFGEAYDGVEVRRIALNMDQVEKYQPPPNPAKERDSRFDSYLTKYGDTSWELDALEPSVLETLIQDELSTLIDMDDWLSVGDEEQQDRDLLTKVGEYWPEVKTFLETQ